MTANDASEQARRLARGSDKSNTRHPCLFAAGRRNAVCLGWACHIQSGRGAQLPRLFPLLVPRLVAPDDGGAEEGGVGRLSKDLDGLFEGCQVDA